MKKIFVFVNSGRGTDWQVGLAMCEDGHCLASHVSSNYSFFRHDMGLTSDWKHERYKEHCPEGYELVEIEDHITEHKGLMAAYKLNQAMACEAAPNAADSVACE